MTLTEHKRQAQEIAEILMNFSGKEDDAEKFAKNLLGKYQEFGEFNAKALECKNLAEFKNLASANGMNFESDEEANELFLGLSKGKKEVEKAILSAEEMYAVYGGNHAASTNLSIFPEDNMGRMMQVGPAPVVAPQRQAQQGLSTRVRCVLLCMGVGVLGLLVESVGFFLHQFDFETGRALSHAGFPVAMAGSIGALIGSFSGLINE